MINYADVIEQVSVPVLVVDGVGTILVANQKARRSFPSIAIGGTTENLSDNNDDIPKLLRKTIKANDKRSANIFTAGSREREYMVIANLLAATNDADGTRCVLTFEDLTPLRIAKAMRSDFVANVSHEIRSPLTAISGFVESLQDAEDIDDDTRRLFLSMMGKEATRMTSLVSDLLSLSKVEAKESRAVKKRVETAQVLQQACETVGALAKERGKQVKLSIEANLPKVLGKHDDLLRVFINLLENAINYSWEDSEISLVATAADKHNPLAKPAICIAVSDKGDGIPEAEIPRLTERFYRVDKSRSRNVGGTGLGLAIAKHILVRHRGKLLIQSTQGVGSTFSVFLPVDLSD